MILLTFGGLVVLLALVMPSSGLLHSIRARPDSRLNELVLGITLFKYSLVAFGLFLMALGRLPIWESLTPRRKDTTDPRYNFLNLAIITAILCVAAVLRLYGLDAGLWHDEILTYVNYARLPFVEIVSTYWDQNQHFLYTLLAHASIVVFGDSEWSLRFPAVLFGVASIWALYLFGRQVTTERESLLACALIAFSYHHVWFSQNARGYIGLLFWTLLASWLLLRGLREGRPHLWLLYSAAAALGVYTNTAMLFVILGHIIIYQWQTWTPHSGRWPCRLMGFCLGFCFSGFLILLLHALVLPQMLISVEVSTVPAWKQPLWAVLEFMTAIEIGFAGTIAAIAALLVFGMGLWSFARTQPAVVELMIVPATACAAVALIMGYHVWPRLFFFTFGFATLIVVRGTIELGKMTTRLLAVQSSKGLNIGTVFAAALILVSALSVPRAYAPKQDFRGALNFVEAIKEPGDAIVTVGLATFTYKNFYERGWREVRALEDLNAIRAGAKHTWLIYTFPTHVGAVYPEIKAAIEREFQIIKQFPGTIGDGTIFVSRSAGIRS